MATIETYYEYILDNLTKDSVSIVKTTFADINGEKTQIGTNKRIAYANSPFGRSTIRKILPEAHANSVFALWGDEPTASDPPTHSNESDK